MLERILKFSIRQRWIVLLALLGIALLGAYNYNLLPIDAVPDIINACHQANAAQEAEARFLLRVLPFVSKVPNHLNG